MWCKRTDESRTATGRNGSNIRCRYKLLKVCYQGLGKICGNGPSGILSEGEKLTPLFAIKSLRDISI